MNIIKAGSRPQKKASLEYFQGNVFQNLIIESPEPARVRAIKVLFEPKARTAWHTHPLGQTLYVLKGIGLVGNRKGPPKLIYEGDTVWIPPNEEHWHGASEDCQMEHIAIQEAIDGKVADWLEQVSDHDYSLTK